MASFENQMQRDVCQDTVFCESVEDFILPDYMPEIGRVLRISTTLIPERCYLGSDATEFSGRISYRLLYADSEGHVTESPLEGRYRYRVSHGEAAVHTAFTSEKIDSTGIRPTAPRRINIRTRIAARPHLLYTEGVGLPTTSLVGDERVESLYSEHRILEREAIFPDAIPCRGEVIVESCSHESLQLIATEASVMPERLIAHDGYISIEGKMICTLLLQKEGERPCLKECTIPFREDVNAEGCAEGDALTAEAFCAPPAITLEGAGEDVILRIEGECCLSILLYRHRSLSLLKDFYVHGATHTVRRKETELTQLVGCYAGNVTVRGDGVLPEGFRTESSTAVPYFTTKDATATLCSNSVLIEGNLTVTLLAADYNNTEKAELLLPFRAELPIGAACAPTDRILYTLTPVGGSASWNGSSVRLSTELYLTACVLHEERVALPTEAIKTADIPQQSHSEIKLYYPCEQDSLWSVGKHYAIPIAELQKQNGIPEEEDTAWDDRSSIDGYAYLFVGGL